MENNIMEKKRLLVEKQIDLQLRMQSLANVNLVTCGHCGSILLHDRKDETIECFGCEKTLDVSDCPDYWYEGCQDSAEFNQ